jgi:hypothetical protein
VLLSGVAPTDGGLKLGNGLGAFGADGFAGDGVLNSADDARV